MSAREELLAVARRHMWAAWQLSAEELASQAASTLLGLGMLVPEGGAAELEKLRTRVAELEAEPRLSADEVAGWLLKKAREYPSAPERQESVPDAIARLASKVTRGAIRSNNTAGAPSLPWAHTMSDDDLHGFLGDLLSAAIGRWQHSPEVPDRKVLAAVELACANWRTPGEGYRSDDPDGDE